MQERNNAGVLAWFLCGAAVGAAAALLLAPETGEKTRKQLLKGAERGKKNLMESGSELFARGRELFERGRELAEETAEVFERGRKIAEKTIEDRI
jgi:gas vesicle protein